LSHRPRIDPQGRRLHRSDFLLAAQEFAIDVAYLFQQIAHVLKVL
jgi:hypothetical protein